MAFRSGYCGVGYANPYYHGGFYDDYYASPVVVASYDTSTSAYLGDPIPTQVADVGLDEFDLARENFQLGQYQAALAATDKALVDRPNDAILHEFRALCLFAIGEYRKSAVVLNSLLATAPGWDWATMIGLYMNPQEYERHLRALERYRNANPKDASARFVLAYQYLVCGQKEAAATELRKVVQLEPSDRVAAQLLSAVAGEPPAEAAAATAPAVPLPPPVEPLEPAPGGAAASPNDGTAEESRPTQQTDMVGKWSAKRDDGSTFQFSIDDQGDFEWVVRTKDGKETKITGTYSFAEDMIVLESGAEGTMIGRVKSEGPDTFQFKLIGGPASDPGLTFERAKE